MVNLQFNFEVYDLTFFKFVQKLKDMPDSWVWISRQTKSFYSSPRKASRHQYLSPGRLTTMRTMSYSTSTKLPVRKCLTTLLMRCIRKNSRNSNLRKKEDLTYLQMQCSQTILITTKFNKSQSVTWEQTRLKIHSSEPRQRRR